MDKDRKSSAAAAAAAASQPASATTQPPSPVVQPLISFSTIDAPSQRFYAVGLAVLIQAWKYSSIVRSWFGSPSSNSVSSIALQAGNTTVSLSTALFLNFAVLFVLARLGIPLLDPRLASSRASSPTQTGPASKAVLQPPKAVGLTYLHYLALFVALSATDATLLGSASTNPLLLTLNGMLSLLQIAASTLGLTVPMDSAFPDILSRQTSINEGHVRIRDLIKPKSHILGQHTIHILPHSTAKLLPSSACYCVGPQSPQVIVPVLFSNAHPDLLQYSITDFATGQPSYYNVSVDNLIPFGASNRDDKADEVDAINAAARTRSSKHSSRQDDLLDDEDALDDPTSLLKGVSYAERARIRAERRSQSLGKRSAALDTPTTKRLPSTRANKQLLWHLPITQPGRVRLERVLDKSRNDARISTSEALVVHCPSTKLIPASSAPVGLTDPLQTQHKCPGDRADFAARVSGVAPLELEYRRIFDPLPSVSGSHRPRVNARQDNKRKISRISPPHHTSPLLLPEAEALLSPTDRLALARERTRVASRRTDAGHEDFSWAVSVDVDMPLSSIDLDQSGNYTYALESVTDACGNRVAVNADRNGGLSLAQKARKRIKGDGDLAATYHQSVVVHSRRSVAFDPRQCRPGHPLPLLRNSAGIDLTVQSALDAEQSGDWDVRVSFQPDNSAANKGLWSRPTGKASTMQLTLAAHSSQLPFTVEKPGTYRIDEINGPFCAGEVGSPWTCEVVDVPPPTAQINFSSIEDRCAGPVGVKAMSVLTGSPPFQLEYEVTKQGRHPERKIRTIFDQTRDELDFRPDVDGAVTYKFVKLHDSNYRGIPLDGPTFTQVFHPLSSAEFTAPIRAHDDRAVMQSCSGKQAEADVRFSGAGPWDLTYAVRAGDNVETKEVQGITQSPHTLKIDIPKSVAASGGLVTVSLVKIRDARGCEKSLATRDLNVEVRRVQPSVGFLPTKAEKGRLLEVLHGKASHLPIRLSGQGPWHVDYSWKAHESAEEVDLNASVNSVDAELLAEHPGLYRIKRIRDNYCPGIVLEGQDDFTITVRPQPHVQFATDGGVPARNGSLVRAPVCRGKPDSVDIVMSGQFPVDVEYEHIAPSWSASSEAEAAAPLASAAHEVALHGKRRRTAFTSALKMTNLELSTALPGWHTYVIDSVGDAIYAPSRLQGFPTDSPRRLEQMVFPLPSASFVGTSSKGRRPSLCVGDGLDRLSGSPPTLKLQGQAPFTVSLEVSTTSSASSGPQSYKFTRSGIKSNEYKLDLSTDEFAFSGKGLWSIRVLDVTDANQCHTATATDSKRAGQDDKSMVIEVAETADIASVSTRADYCIGERVDFSLQGSPPWTVSYDFNGKSAQAAITTPEFSRVAERPGVLTIKSVAHQQNQCRRDINARISQEMVKTIHDLPTVRISEGNHFVEDLREGNQAEIIFNFQGVAPFSFTYQRSEPVDTHSRPKVLETNTVSGILENRYSIWAAVEGTWSVTWLQDRWCQVSLDYQSGAATPLGKSRLAIRN